MPSPKVIEVGRQIAAASQRRTRRDRAPRPQAGEPLRHSWRSGPRFSTSGSLKHVEAPARTPLLTSAPTADATSPGTLLRHHRLPQPEQVKGFTADPRSDLFSLGCVLYQMLAGRLRLPGRSAGETLSADPARHPPPLYPRTRGLVAAVERLPGEALRRSLRLCQGPGVALRVSPRACSPATTQRSRPRPGRAPRPRSRRVPLACRSCAALAGLGLWRCDGARAPPIRSLAVLPFADRSAQPGEEYLACGLTEAHHPARPGERARGHVEDLVGGAARRRGYRCRSWPSGSASKPSSRARSPARALASGSRAARRTAPPTATSGPGSYSGRRRISSACRTRSRSTSRAKSP